MITSDKQTKEVINKKIKKYYQIVDQQKPILVIHKELIKDKEYKFFCNRFQGKDIIVLSPRKPMTTYARHIDLIEIALFLSGCNAYKAKQLFDFYDKKHFLKSGFYGTYSKNPKNNFIEYFIVSKYLYKKIPTTIQKKQEKLTKKLNNIINLKQKEYTKLQKRKLKPKKKTQIKKHVVRK
jgi:hypothetical protein